MKIGDRVTVTEEAVRRWGCTFKPYAGRVGRLTGTAPRPTEIVYRNGDRVTVRDNEYERAAPIVKKLTRTRRVMAACGHMVTQVCPASEKPVCPDHCYDCR